MLHHAVLKSMSLNLQVPIIQHDLPTVSHSQCVTGNSCPEVYPCTIPNIPKAAGRGSTGSSRCSDGGAWGFWAWRPVFCRGGCCLRNELVLQESTYIRRVHPTTRIWAPTKVDPLAGKWFPLERNRWLLRAVSAMNTNQHKEATRAWPNSYIAYVKRNTCHTMDCTACTST